MVYNFTHATTTMDSVLLGSDKQPVPLIMYFYTVAFFSTYHSTANNVLRKLNSFTEDMGKTMAWVMFFVFVFAVGYCWSFMETFGMANPLMASFFYYEKMRVFL